MQVLSAFVLQIGMIALTGNDFRRLHLKGSHGTTLGDPVPVVR